MIHKMSDCECHTRHQCFPTLSISCFSLQIGEEEMGKSEKFTSDVSCKNGRLRSFAGRRVGKHFEPRCARILTESVSRDARVLGRIVRFGRENFQHRKSIAIDVSMPWTLR